ncbi:54S ribosomal protein L32 [Yarrowia sp. C11]|nr:54S ribosomal protein L32 [Yarrowia sp. E02]KAG5365383.1 54S ribosomal protein L32 [Yarrowia sp. C11]
MALLLTKPFVAALGARLPVMSISLAPGLLGGLFGGVNRDLDLETPSREVSLEQHKHDECDHGIVYAVPKKKVSYGQKRKRFLAETKALKPLSNINRCPACGHAKRMHTLCMHCFYELRSFFAKKTRDAEALVEKKQPPTLSARDEAYIYKKKVDREYYEKLKDTPSYVMRYPRAQSYQSGRRFPKSRR